MTFKHIIPQSKKKQPVRTGNTQSFVTLINTSVLLTVLLFGVLYLQQVNALSTKGFAIKSIEKKIAYQKKENEKVQLRVIEAQSLGSLQKRIEGLKLVRSDRVNYITSTSQSVAALR